MSFKFLEPEIPDIQEEEPAEGEGGEQQQGETNANAEDAEPKEQALGVSTPTGAEEEHKKGSILRKFLLVVQTYITFFPLLTLAQEICKINTQFRRNFPIF